MHLKFVTHEITLLMLEGLVDIKALPKRRLTMRTTLALDDDVFELAARQAKLRGVSLGKTVSDLLRRGLTASTPARKENGIVMFQLPADSPKVTTEEVRRILAEGA